MIVFPRRAPKLSNGFKVILEDGTPEKIERRRYNGFKIVDDDDVDDEIEEQQTKKRKAGGDGLPDSPMKRKKININSVFDGSGIVYN